MNAEKFKKNSSPTPYSKTREKKKGEKINRILIIYREKKKKKLSRFEIFTGVNEPENIRTYKGWGNTIKIVVRLQNDMSGCVGRLE